MKNYLNKSQSLGYEFNNLSLFDLNTTVKRKNAVNGELSLTDIHFVRQDEYAHKRDLLEYSLQLAEFLLDKNKDNEYGTCVSSINILLIDPYPSRVPENSMGCLTLTFNYNDLPVEVNAYRLNLGNPIEVEENAYCRLMDTLLRYEVSPEQRRRILEDVLDIELSEETFKHFLSLSEYLFQLTFSTQNTEIPNDEIEPTIVLRFIPNDDSFIESE